MVVDHKTAATDADLDARVASYRAQGGAYALNVVGATAEPIARVVLRDMPDQPAAMGGVRDALPHIRL